MELLARQCSAKGETWGLPTTALGSLFSDKDERRKGCLFEGRPSRVSHQKKAQKRLKEKLAQRAAGTGAVWERAEASVCPQRPLVDSSSKVWRDLR